MGAKRRSAPWVWWSLARAGPPAPPHQRYEKVDGGDFFFEARRAGGAPQKPKKIAARGCASTLVGLSKSTRARMRSKRRGGTEPRPRGARRRGTTKWRSSDESEIAVTRALLAGRASRLGIRRRTAGALGWPGRLGYCSRTRPCTPTCRRVPRRGMMGGL